MGKNDEAADQFHAILSANPNFWRAHNCLADIHLQEGDIPRATKHLQRSLTLNMDQPEIEDQLVKLEGRSRPEDAAE